MVLVFIVLTMRPALGRRLPPLIGALLVGAVASVLLGRFNSHALESLQLVQPVLQLPQWSWAAMVELVVPLTITVLVVQNGQGIAVLKAVGHEPPVDSITVACGAGALLSAVVGSVSTCLTGPTNAIITASGERSRHYVAGITTGAFAVVFGLLSPAFTSLMLHAP